MGGGPSTIDIWDLKPGAPTGGPFRRSHQRRCGDLRAHADDGQADAPLAIVRSMSTREADHDRGRYYMHTGYVPNPNIEHPSYGSVLAHELIDQRPDLEIPPFVSSAAAAWDRASWAWPGRRFRSTATARSATWTWASTKRG
jgi:hypothetical protein